MTSMHRRHFISNAATATAGLAFAIPSIATNLNLVHRYKIGVCDWMLLKRQRPGAITLAKEIGVDGLEVDMGSLGNRDTFENGLDSPAFRQQFQQLASENKIEFCSMAMSGFYAQSFAERPTYERMVGDCITTMTQLSISTAFLPLGVSGDLVKRPELRATIVQRLKVVGKLAEPANVVIGIETSLDASEEVQLLDEIGSQSIRSYFNFANALQHGRNLHHELRTLGKDRICQIHCTDEDGVWLENNKRLDVPAVKKTLDELGWSGWLVMERSRDANNSGDVRGNFGANARYLRSVFQAS